MFITATAAEPTGNVTKKYVSAIRAQQVQALVTSGYAMPKGIESKQRVEQREAEPHQVTHLRIGNLQIAFDGSYQQVQNRSIHEVEDVNHHEDGDNVPRVRRRWIRSAFRINDRGAVRIVCSAGRAIGAVWLGWLIHGGLSQNRLGPKLP